MAKQLFIKTERESSGPHSSAEIREMAMNGTLLPSDLISFDREKWGAASSLKGLEFPMPAPEAPKIDLTKGAAKLGKSMMTKFAGAAEVMSTTVSKIHTIRDESRQEQTLVQMEKRSAVQRFLNEDQDPKIIEANVPKILQFLTSQEELLYIAVQKKPVANIAPDCVALTSRRIIFFTIKLFGQVSFNDHLWRNVANATVKEGILGSTFSATVTSGQYMSVDYLPKAQARMLYRYSQEMEEHAVEERRTREMEEARAAAGGVVIQNALVPPTSAGAASAADDPLASLQKLKSMLDAGLISPEEFGAKKTEILSRM